MFKPLLISILTSFSGRIRFYQCSDLTFFKNIKFVISSYPLQYTYIISVYKISYFKKYVILN